MPKSQIANSYQIIHRTIGRIRIQVDRLREDPVYASHLQQSIAFQQFVTGVRINAWARSIVIHYDSTEISASAIAERLTDWIDLPLNTTTNPQHQTAHCSQSEWRDSDLREQIDATAGEKLGAAAGEGVGELVGETIGELLLGATGAKLGAEFGAFLGESSGEKVGDAAVEQAIANHAEHHESTTVDLTIVEDEAAHLVTEFVGVGVGETVGRTIGEVVGEIFLGPIGALIGAEIGGLLGGEIGEEMAESTEHQSNH